MMSSQNWSLNGLIKYTIEYEKYEPILDYYLKKSVDYLSDSQKIDVMQQIAKITDNHISFAGILACIYFKNSDKNPKICHQIEQLDGMNKILKYLKKYVSPTTFDEAIQNIVEEKLYGYFRKIKQKTYLL